MGLFTRGKTIYYPGATLHTYYPQLVNNWKLLLSQFGIRAELNTEIHSGWPLWNQGYYEEHTYHQQQLRNYLTKHNITKIITTSPEAYYMFTTFHPHIQTIHTTQVAHTYKHKITEHTTITATWHDNTTQVRRNNIIEQPRKLLRTLGITLIEFTENKHNTQCLGTSTGLVNNSPRLATKLAQRRIKHNPTQILITDSPEDYKQLKEHTTQTVYELSEVLVDI